VYAHVTALRVPRWLLDTYVLYYYCVNLWLVSNRRSFCEHHYNCYSSYIIHILYSRRQSRCLYYFWHFLYFPYNLFRHYKQITPVTNVITSHIGANKPCLPYSFFFCRFQYRLLYLNFIHSIPTATHATTVKYDTTIILW